MSHTVRPLVPEAPSRRSGGARLPCLTLVLLAALACACSGEAPRVDSDKVALNLLGVYPYPVVSAGEANGDENLKPLIPAYLVYINEEDYSLAASMFAEVYEDHPELHEASFLRGVSLVLADRPAEAIPALERVNEHFPGFPPAHWYLGQALFAVDRDEEALTQMHIVVDIGEEYSKRAAKVIAGEPVAEIDRD